ncbi:hypothetical protein EON63_04675 [archaeon]|nr:MAG: hypothetical protein EON63_04675 [archaeon]
MLRADVRNSIPPCAASRTLNTGEIVTILYHTIHIHRVPYIPIHLSCPSLHTTYTYTYFSRASGAVAEPEEITAERRKSFVFSHGLTTDEAQRRLLQYGRNELPETVCAWDMCMILYVYGVCACMCMDHDNVYVVFEEKSRQIWQVCTTYLAWCMCMDYVACTPHPPNSFLPHTRPYLSGTSS